MGRVIDQDYQWLSRRLHVALKCEDGTVDGRWDSGEDGAEFQARVIRKDGAVLTLDLSQGNEAPLRATVVPEGREAVWVVIDGQGHRVQRVERGSGGTGDQGAAESGISPMTGQLVEVKVAAGDTVEDGTPLFVVEAMKMEYVVRAPFDGRVEAVNAEAGSQVSMGQQIVTLEPTDAAS